MVNSSEVEYLQLCLDKSKHSIKEIDEDIENVKLMINNHLSEPYSVYVYRFFLNNWPELCLMAKHNGELIGCIMAKVEPHKNVRIRGYIGMLAVNEEYRGLGIAKRLINQAIDIMIERFKCDEITLETEVVNKKALSLYENFGFVRVKRLFRYYLNKHDAYRLVLPITEKSAIRSGFLPQLDPEEAIEGKY